MSFSKMVDKLGYCFFFNERLLWLSHILISGVMSVELNLEKKNLSKGGDFFVVVRTREQNHTQGSGEGIPMKRLKRGAKICYITN